MRAILFTIVAFSLALSTATSGPYSDVFDEILTEMRAGVNITRDGVAAFELQFAQIQQALIAINWNVIYMNEQLDRNSQTVADAIQPLYGVLLAIAILLCAGNFVAAAKLFSCQRCKRSNRPVGFVQELTDVRDSAV